MLASKSEICLSDKYERHDIKGDISSIDIDSTDSLLAVGCKSGEINIYKFNEFNYEPYCHFLSHETEFDYYKSLEIKKEIKKIHWLPHVNQDMFLLSTNESTIKLWRLSEFNHRPARFSLSGNRTKTTQDLKDLDVTSAYLKASVRRTFTNTHTYHINSLSVNSDQETFLSADDLRINIWNLQVTNRSFNIIDIKPNSMENLTEVITCAQFHPSSCALLAYSTTKGVIRLCDMRSHLTCNSCVYQYCATPQPSNKGYFSEILDNISWLSFGRTGRYLICRTFLSIKVWDVNMPRYPVEEYMINDDYRRSLCALYYDGCVSDKFGGCSSQNDEYIMTGSFDNRLHLIDRVSYQQKLFRIINNATEMRGELFDVHKIGSRPLYRNSNEVSPECADFTAKMLYFAWGPKWNMLIAANSTSFYCFNGEHNAQNCC